MNVTYRPEEQVRQISASRTILEDSQRLPGAYTLNICSRDFVVLPGVFSPQYFDSTHIFTKNFPFRSEASFLEIGAGTGVTAVTAALKGARKVLAVDINSEAVENTRLNAAKHSVSDRLEARLSDVFSAISPNENFDTIYWNMPFIYVEAYYLFHSTLERALYDPGYATTLHFFAQAPSFLSPEGRIIIGWGSHGDVKFLEQLTAAKGMSMSEISREQGTEGVAVDFILFEVHPNAQTLTS